ncbi:MAG: PQQ-dependent sugar dehydrogenase, partial [Saprospiraceae bacterium]|nr:PQQ-dependent sugar dehydrogenase [Saprospiraceae bacterium]
MNTARYLFSALLLLGLACSSINRPKDKDLPASDLPLESIRLPEGFQIDIYAADVTNARSMDLSPGGVLYVGTRSQGDVYALVDRDGDFVADEKHVLATGLKMPNGVAFRDGDLYIAEVSRILKLEDIENRLADPPAPKVVYDRYPTETHHGWKFIDFGPDGKLYVPVGAPCNICESKDPVFNSLTRINPDGSGFEIVQEGIRNTVGFTWHPDNQELWFTDNGRDWMGDDL